MFPHTKTHTLLMKSKNRNYTHNYTTQIHSLIRCLFRDIRTNRYYGKKIASRVSLSLGILLYLCLILPIRQHQKRNDADDTCVFYVSAVCQMTNGAILGAFFWESRTSGIFLFDKTKRRCLWHH